MKNSSFREDLAALAAHVAVLDEHTYQVLGQRFSIAYQHSYTKWHQPFHHFGQNIGPEPRVRASLQQQLAQALYGTFYCAGTGSPPGPPKSGQPPLPAPTELARTTQLLSEANATPNGFDPAWTVYAFDTYGNAFVQKNGAQRQLLPNQWVFTNPTEASLQIGSVVKLLIAKEDTTLQSVFYHVRGTELVAQQAEFVRVYFHTTFEGARLLVQEITRTFNEYRLPFLFKCLNHPDLFTRADSAVLYVSKFDFPFAQCLLQPVLDLVAPHLQAPVPLFTRCLRPGVSFSEDPANGQSFGMSRCNLLAEGLVAAYHERATPGPEQLAVLHQTLADNGLAVERIYLNPNSHFSYNFSTPLPDEPSTCGA